jgi:transcriptional regulator with XRE-family HTH domain
MGKVSGSLKRKNIAILAIYALRWFSFLATPLGRRKMSGEKTGNANTPKNEARLFYRRLGRRLRLERQARGLSQTALAQALGLTFQQVQKYESGANRMPLDRLLAACRILRVSPMRFLAEPGENEDDAEAGELSRTLAALRRVGDPEMRGKIGRVVRILAAG